MGPDPRPVMKTVVERNRWSEGSDYGRSIAMVMPTAGWEERFGLTAGRWEGRGPERGAEERGTGVLEGIFRDTQELLWVMGHTGIA